MQGYDQRDYFFFFPSSPYLLVNRKDIAVDPSWRGRGNRSSHQPTMMGSR